MVWPRDMPEGKWTKSIKVADEWMIIYLVGGEPTPLKNMTSSIGMIIPNMWKVIRNVPNHQPVI